VASAQIKSAVLLAGLQAEGTTTVTEPHKSRDHTERMLSAFGVKLAEDKTSVSIKGGQQLTAADIFVPGDISSAAFFLAAGAMIPNSRIVLKNVGLNPTRTGIIDVLQNMGAKLEIIPSVEESAEPYGDLIIETSSLKAVEIGGDIIPRLIDEIPIDTVVSELRKLGAEIEPTEDGMKVYGKQTLKGGAKVSSHGDHRIGMMLGIASCLTEEPIEIGQTDAIHVSYPNFFDHLNKLSNKS
jgi:3-phosphoshikimate 1-carboxyvinyltransferase